RPSAKKYANLAQMLGLPSTNHASGTRSLMKEIKKLRKALGIPENFNEYNIEYTQDTINNIIDSTLQDSCTNTNPIQPQEEDITKILKQLLSYCYFQKIFISFTCKETFSIIYYNYIKKAQWCACICYI